MEAVLARLDARAAAGEKKPSLALHACCGPCSSAVLEALRAHFAVTIVYYNPNIWPEAEYRRREAELERFAARFAPETPVVELEYRPAQFDAAAAGLENEPERGSRCTACYRLRMERAARWAAEHGFDWFCTTLSISPHKDAARINAIGRELEGRYGVRHLPNDFKKKDGYKRSLELSSQYGLYRQDYCGCRYSARRAQKEAER